LTESSVSESDSGGEFMAVNASERALVFLLRLSGWILLLAVPAIFLPDSWMASIHRWLGLGTFPEAPIVDYLARTESALYAIFGGLLLVISRDVRRYAPVVRYVAVTGLVFGVVVLGIDLHAGLPSYWVAGEGPAILVSSVVFLVLLHSALRDSD
jgi:hypothetical protein